MPLIYFCEKNDSQNETKTEKYLFQKVTQNLRAGKKTAFVSFSKNKKNYLTLTCLFSKGTDKAQPAAKSGKEN